MATAQEIHRVVQQEAATRADGQENPSGVAWAARYTKAMVDAIHLKQCEQAELLAKLVERLEPIVAYLDPNPKWEDHFEARKIGSSEKE